MSDRMAEIETVICDMPKRRDWSHHGIVRTLVHRVILRLVTKDGVGGWGESTALAQWEASRDAAMARRRPRARTSFTISLPRRY